jgi:hypothetical protein
VHHPQHHRRSSSNSSWQTTSSVPPAACAAPHHPPPHPPPLPPPHPQPTTRLPAWQLQRLQHCSAKARAGCCPTRPSWLASCRCPPTPCCSGGHQRRHHPRHLQQRLALCKHRCPYTVMPGRTAFQRRRAHQLRQRRRLQVRGALPLSCAGRAHLSTGTSHRGLWQVPRPECMGGPATGLSTSTLLSTTAASHTRGASDGWALDRSSLEVVRTTLEGEAW